MNKIIIIAGNGKLPVEIISSLKLQNINFKILIIKNADYKKELLKYNHEIINLGSIASSLIRLKREGYKNLVLAGGLKRPSLRSIKPDINTIKIFARYTKVFLKGGDNNLLKFVIQEIENLGIKVLNIKKIAPDIFIDFGIHSQKKPSGKSQKYIQKAKRILDTISCYDIGQSLIIQQGNIVGIEAMEGTDELIKRCSSLFIEGDKPILVKLLKKKQEMRVDLPTIGINTIRLCKKYSIQGIAFSANKTIFLEKKKFLQNINFYNIFLIGI